MSVRSKVISWALIALLALLSVVLDHFRLLTSHFNWFLATQLVFVAAVVVAVSRLSRTPVDVNKKPEITGREEQR